MAYEVLRPLSDWHEDDGDVLWYRVPINEPPFVSSPLRSDWLIETNDGRCVEVDDEEEDHRPWATHWCPLPRVIPEHDPQRLLREAMVDRAEIAALREACTLALGIMEQKNKVNVPPLAKFIEVKFAPDDVAALRAALEKK